MTDLTPRQILNAIDRALAESARRVGKSQKPASARAIAVKPHENARAGKVAKPKPKPANKNRRARR